MKKEMVLLGSGGHAKSVIDVIETLGNYEIYGVVDKGEKGTSLYHNYKIVGQDSDLQEIYNSGIRYAFVCIGFLGQSTVRNRLYDELKQIGFKLPVLIDPTAILAQDVKIGEGTFIGKKAVVNSGAIIGKMAIINTAAIVEHDCWVGDFCHISVNSTLCGEVYVEDESFVGAGTTVIQKIRIGKNCIIGAGSIVVKNVEEQVSFRNQIIPVKFARGDK